MHWKELWIPTVPALEIIIRGTVVYLVLFTLLRVILKRQSGIVGISDLLVVVLIADAAQNAMAGEYHSITDGLILVATIIFWSYALDWLGFHFPWIQRMVRPPALPLIRDGKLLPRNLRKELITKEELFSELHEQGIEDISIVKDAYMEGDGRISVIKYTEEQHQQDRRRGV